MNCFHPQVFFVYVVADVAGQRSLRLRIPSLIHVIEHVIATNWTERFQRLFAHPPRIHSNTLAAI